MSVAKIIELSSESTKSFEDAIQNGIKRASETLGNIQGAWISEQKITCNNGKVTGYRVQMKITFILNSPKATVKRKK